MAKQLQTILTDAATKREQVRRSVVDALRVLFPIESTQYLLEVTNIRVETKGYSSTIQKMSGLEGKTLSEPVRADVRLLNKHNNKVMQTKKNHTLLQLPWMTPRHTFMVEGNEYSIANQPRVKPGVYTRTRANLDIESAFNLARGKNFRLSLQPDTGKFYMEVGTSKIPLYSALKVLGADIKDFDSAWGKELHTVNASSFTKSYENDVNKLQSKLLPSRLRARGDFVAKGTAIRGYLDNTEMDAAVNQITLGKSMGKVNKEALLLASQKLLSVYRKESPEDDRDSLEFKRMHSVEDHFAERIRLKGGEVASKIKFKMNFTKRDPSIEAFMPSGVFTKVIRSFVTSSTLSAQPTQINPVEIIDSSVKVTPLGEGGIANERAIPDEAREAHHTHFGILDTIRTPESSHAGVDVRAAMLAARDKDGNMYTPVWDLKSGKSTHISAAQMSKSIIAFPMQGLKAHSKMTPTELRRKVDVLNSGVLDKVPASKVQYYIDHPSRLYGPSTNLIPMIGSIQGNRAIMGSKQVTQAVPLKDAEAPLVQSESYKAGKSNEQLIADMVNPVSPVNGTVTKVDNDYVYIKDSTGETHEVSYDDHFMLGSKTYLHDTVAVKKGDKVKKGQRLADSIYTRGGTLALGKNLETAYLAYKGLNSNDGVVISESASSKLTSLHMYKHTVNLDRQSVAGKNKFTTHYPTEYKISQLDKLDDRGIIKPGETLETGDPWVVLLREGKPTAEDVMLGRLHRGLIRKYRDASETWSRDYPGIVKDVAVTTKHMTITVMVEAKMKVGDKLSNRYGGKGVVSKILSDDQMPQKQDGTIIDLLFTSAGVVSRINPAQIIEQSIAKAATKEGKPYVFKNFGHKNNAQVAREYMKEHGVSDKEKVYDPVEDKWIDGVNVGPQYILKLFKSTDTNFSARDIGGYDPTGQPMSGGVEGSKKLGGMEINALLAHNSRALLREGSVIRSQKNSEYWRAVQLGLPLPPLKTSLAYDKFKGMLTGSGIKLDQKGDKISVSPLTDKDIISMSSGKITNAKMVRAKDLNPEPGGMFDVVVTGGAAGKRWSHIGLHEPMVNPVFNEPARRLLEMSTSEFKELMLTEGGKAVKSKLNGINLSAEKRRLRGMLKSSRGSVRDDLVKRIKYINALQKTGSRAGDAYVMTKLPVLPPSMRPITPSKSGDLLIDDANYLYRDMILANESIKDVHEADMPDRDMHDARSHAYDSLGALIGLSDPVSPQLMQKNVKGFIKNITGMTPKEGYFQSKLISKPQDLTGRGTAAPDPKLGLDEIGVPEDMAWKMYASFIVRRLVRAGYTAKRAKELIDERGLPAKQALQVELKERPVLYNRAPTLWRHSVVSAYPKLVKGKTIKVNPLVESGMNLDYDGDALQLHLPVTDAGIRDAKKITLSEQLFSDKHRNDLLVFPQHEAIIGIFIATSAKPTAKKFSFKSKKEAWAAYNAGKLTLGDQVKIGG